MIGVLHRDKLEMVDLPGFKNHRVSARVLDVGGSPRVVSILVDSRDAEHPVPLISNQLRALDLRAIAKAVTVVPDTARHAEVEEAMRNIVTRSVVKSRQQISVGLVAEAWNLARDAGLSAPRQAVVERLGITERTASRYIKKARDAHMIPAVWR